MVRACFSGSQACTGIAPCDACAKAIMTRVLPSAMVAGGFNGSIEVAKRFFDAFQEASQELLKQAPHDMAAAMGAPVAQVVEPQETNVEEVKEVEEANSEITEDEVSVMGRVTDVVEEEKVSLSGKSARAMARMARAIKKKRALKKEQEGTHG